MDKLSQTGPSRWERLDEELALDCSIFQVYKRRSRHPVREVVGDFTIIDSTDWIQAIALTSDERLIMVNQFRFGRETFSWEMPGGLLEAGEEPSLGAARELREETGYEGRPTGVIGTCTPNPAIQNNLAHFVLLRDCKPAHELDWDEHEEIELGLFSLEEALEMAHNGQIHNSITYVALFMLQRELHANHG